jgi:hypothetical protein
MPTPARAVRRLYLPHLSGSLLCNGKITVDFGELVDVCNPDSLKCAHSIIKDRNRDLRPLQILRFLRGWILSSRAFVFPLTKPPTIPIPFSTASAETGVYHSLGRPSLSSGSDRVSPTLSLLRMAYGRDCASSRPIAHLRLPCRRRRLPCGPSSPCRPSCRTSSPTKAGGNPRRPADTAPPSAFSDRRTQLTVREPRPRFRRAADRSV